MQTERSVEIDAPIDHVFRVATEQVVAWSLIVVEDEPIVETEDGIGSTFRIVTEERGQRMEFEGKVLDQERPVRNTFEMIGKQFDIHVRTTLRDLGGRTLFTQESTVRGKGFFK